MENLVFMYDSDDFGNESNSGIRATGSDNSEGCHGYEESNNFQDGKGSHGYRKSNGSEIGEGGQVSNVAWARDDDVVGFGTPGRNIHKTIMNFRGKEIAGRIASLNTGDGSSHRRQNRRSRKWIATKKIVNRARKIKSRSYARHTRKQHVYKVVRLGRKAKKNANRYERVRCFKCQELDHIAIHYPRDKCYLKEMFDKKRKRDYVFGNKFGDDLEKEYIEKYFGKLDESTT
ncbi:hypothetical protein L1987_59356 [Smallanthus sonchifolius]|uniref:Uncharacterized protein n=1 Tax=Smallanthus sonchifolius TaxID=185202 RepID=A0ACB9D4Z9_9ASTR|nr:hypothetical protein L1987_59356 [Smallanthus sonchifolius]